MLLHVSEKPVAYIWLELWRMQSPVQQAWLGGDRWGQRGYISCQERSGRGHAPSAKQNFCSLEKTSFCEFWAVFLSCLRQKNVFHLKWWLGGIFLVEIQLSVITPSLGSTFWCCWLGGRKGIRPVKNMSGGMLAWLSVWGEVQICIWPNWCHCHSLSLAPVNPDWFLPFWYRITRVVPDKVQGAVKRL